MDNTTLTQRSSGILMHITSLPSPHGIGDFGPAACRFADFLHETNQAFWQILPLNPTSLRTFNSPYSSISAFAGNVLFISPELLVREGLLDGAALNNVPLFPKKHVDYNGVVAHRMPLLYQACDSFFTVDKARAPYNAFCRKHAAWLDDFALFSVLSQHFKTNNWTRWPREIRDRDSKALSAVTKQFAAQLKKEKCLQFLFFQQWHVLKKYCNKKNIQFVGDIPIYVDYGSADVWAHRNIFKLDEKGLPLFVGGVPPDYFSQTGQRWGNPVYDWKALKANRYQWWVQRFAHNLKLFDMLRVDHFRGLVAYWEIPVGEKTAIKGAWAPVPADDLFAHLCAHFKNFPIIAEDLGIITPDVKEVMRRFDFPGMRLLIFAFGEDADTHPYLPHNYIERCIALTGTHDTNTMIGWYQNEASAEEKKCLCRYLKIDNDEKNLHWKCIDAIMASKAQLTIFPMQDVLGLGASARMNKPSIKSGNWGWRISSAALNDVLRDELATMTARHKRA